MREVTLEKQAWKAVQKPVLTELAIGIQRRLQREGRREGTGNCPEPWIFLKHVRHRVKGKYTTETSDLFLGHPIFMHFAHHPNFIHLLKKCERGALGNCYKSSVSHHGNLISS